MKKITLAIISIMILSACNLDVSLDDEPTMSFTIPETITEVDNSGDITVNGETVTLSGEKLKV